MNNGKQFRAALLGCEEFAGLMADSSMAGLGGSSFRLNRFSKMAIAACWDENPAYARIVAEKQGMRAMSLDEIMNDPEIDMIINTDGPSRAFDISKMALEHGKHLFVSKVIGKTLDEGRTLCEMAKEKGLRLGAGPDCFLSGSMQTARDLLDKGLLGDVHSGVISLSRDNRTLGESLPSLYEAGGGILQDMSGYYLNTLCSLIGPVKRVSAFGSVCEATHHVRKIDSPVFGEDLTQHNYDLLAASLAFESGAMVTLHLNSVCIPEQRYIFDLFGSDGVLRLGHPHDFDQPVILQQAGGAPFQVPLHFGFTGSMFGLGAAEMAWAIEAGRPQRASAEMALHICELMWGITQSAQTGKIYEMTTAMARPEPLPQGFVGNGYFRIDEESALVN